MRIKSKLLLSNLVVGLIAISISIFFISQLLAIQSIAQQEVASSIKNLSLAVSVQTLKNFGATISDSITKVIWVFILGTLAFIISSILFVWSFSRRFVQPLNELQSTTKEIIKGNLDKKVHVNSKDEFSDLADSFNIMTGKLKDTIEEIEQRVKDRTRALEDQQKITLSILDGVEKEKAETSALLASIGDGVIATDTNANIIFINPAAEKLTGWKVNDLMGKNFYEALKMIDEKDKPIKEANTPLYFALKIGQKVISSIQKSYYYVKKDGGKLPVSVSVTPVLMNDKIIGAIDVFRDIAQEKLTDKAKTEFVSLASHQLRTPLSSINWNTEMLLSGDAGRITKTQRQYLEEVYKSEKRMADLVNSLLNVSRIDLGTFAIAPELCDLPEISKSVLEELVPEIKFKKMKISESYDEGLGGINVDPKLMRIILQNLLSNAVKYTPEKGNVSVSIQKQNENVLIEVKDTGYGIPKKEQDKVFEKLFRAENTRGKETDGTGLGLYIVKSILDQAGGKVWFVSEENKGTAFYVTIPITGMKSKGGDQGFA